MTLADVLYESNIMPSGFNLKSRLVIVGVGVLGCGGI